MYEAHFGLNDLPFRIVPDLLFYVDSPPHRAAVATLRDGLDRGESFSILTGDAGSGKTTVVRKLLAEIDRDGFALGEMSGAELGGDELLRGVAKAFGIPLSALADPLAELRQWLARLGGEGRRALLVIDEAQGVDADSLRRLAELAALGDGEVRWLHVCLVGQHAPPGVAALERLGQPLGIGATCGLRPLDAAETREYILHRLRQAGWSGRPAFGVAATEAIHARCEGIPARINLLSNRVLLALYTQAANEADAECVRQVDDLLKSELAGPARPGGGLLAPSPPDAAGRASSAAVRRAGSASPAATPVPAPEPTAPAVAAGPVNAGRLPGGTDLGIRGFAIADFPLVHTRARGEPSAAAGAGPAATPAVSQGLRTVAESAHLVPLHLHAAAGTPAAGAARRRWLPLAAVALALTGAGIAWSLLQGPEGGGAGPGLARLPDAGTTAGPGAPSVGGAVRSGVVEPPTVMVAPVATAADAEPVAVTSPDASPPPLAATAAGDRLPRLDPAPAAAPAARRRAPPAAADGLRVSRAEVAAAAGPGRAQAGPRLQVQPETAPPTAAGPARPPAGAAAGEPPLARPQAVAQGEATAAPVNAAASCSAAAETLGLCARPPGGERVREAAPPPLRATPPPPCEPSRSALGLCAER